MKVAAFDPGAGMTRSAYGAREETLRPYRCAGCGEVVRLTVRDPLPSGWLTEAYGYGGTKTRYWCGRECREEAG